MALEQYVDEVTERFAEHYKTQGKLTLILALIIEVPELEQLNAEHDEFVVRELMRHLLRLKLVEANAERRRLAELVLNQVHYGLIVMLKQGPRAAKRTLADLKLMFLVLLQNYVDSSQS